MLAIDNADWTSAASNNNVLIPTLGLMDYEDTIKTFKADGANDNEKGNSGWRHNGSKNTNVALLDGHVESSPFLNFNAKPSYLGPYAVVR